MAAELVNNGDKVEGDFEKVTTIYTLKAATKQEIEQWIEQGDFKPEHCEHSYDCCGRFYRHYSPEIVKLTRTQDGTGRTWFEVHDTRYRNV